MHRVVKLNACLYVCERKRDVKCTVGFYARVSVCMRCSVLDVIVLIGCFRIHFVLANQMRRLERLTLTIIHLKAAKEQQQKHTTGVVAYNAAYILYEWHIESCAGAHT